MRHLYRIIFFLILISGCNKNNDFDSDVHILTLDDIKREYEIADSLNYLDDRSNIDTSTVILGVDKRNGKIIIRTCRTRGFGCMLFPEYFTLEYLNCDSVCCEKNSGYWQVDYVGIAGSRSVVGCVPDTLQ